MSSQLIPIYASGAALIALMVAFSTHNRKMGWKKVRPTMLEALNDLYADLGVGSEPSPAIAHVPIVQADVPDADFSAQLVKLRGALGTSLPVSTKRAGAEPGQMVLVSSTKQKSR